MLKNILQLLLKIENTTGTGCKKLIETMLVKNWSDDLEYVLNLALNQFVLTHLNKLSDTDVKSSKTASMEELKLLMIEATTVPAMNNGLRDRITEFVNLFEDEEEKRMITMIVTKNVNIGLGRKLINKAMKKTLNRDIIPVPSAMLADKGLEKIEKWICDYLRANIKYDGVRILSMFTHTDGWRFFTRNFNELDASVMTNIIANLNDCFRNQVENIIKYKLEGFFVDGELIILDGITEGENSSASRQSITGEVNKILKGNAKKDIDKQFDYVVFDIDKLKTLEVGKGIELYDSRRVHLETYFKGKLFDNISLAKEWIIENTDEGKQRIREIYDELIANGEEGLIIKNPHSVYECKRGKYWIKMKEIHSADLEVVGVIEGTGKMVGTLGAITVKFATGQTLNVGSGFTEESRANIWSDSRKIIGQIVEVEYNAKSKDKKGKESLFLPIFKSMRIDKTEAENY